MERQKSPISPLNIYTAIAANKRRTALVMVAFVLFVDAVVLLIVLYLDVLVRSIVQDVQGTGDAMPNLSLLTASLVAVGGMVIALLLVLWAYRKSDSLVLSISEARPAERDKFPELFRTVENLCIGAGLPMPRVYIITDTAPNAFATGRDPQHASIAVTSGLLEKLEKLELEGVIAHELSHIRNFDTRLMVVAAVLVGFIAILADILLRITWYGAGHRPRYRGKGEGPTGVIALPIAFIVIILAPIVARMLQMAISRQREYLADASAAMLTRYPMGLARALEKIAKDTEPLEVATKGTAHLYIANPLKGQESFLNNLFSTHPPIEDRIARLSTMAGEAIP